MRQHKLYLPELYHAHHIQVSEDIPFWLDLARQTGGPVLELGIGTGRVSRALVEAGYTVIGLDRDHAMLSFLKSHLPQGLKDKCGVFQANMIAFNLAKTFGLIILPCNTLSTLRIQEMRSLFGLIAKHLSEGGLFAADLPNPNILDLLPREGDSEIETFFSHPVTGFPVQVSSTWKQTGTEIVIYWHYDQLFPDGRTERVSMSTCHYLYDWSIYVEDLEKAGLKVVSQYGDFEKHPFDPLSPNLILIARRS